MLPPENSQNPINNFSSRGNTNRIYVISKKNNLSFEIFSVKFMVTFVVL